MKNIIKPFKKAVYQDIQERDYSSQVMNYAYYTYFFFMNRERSAEQTDLFDWAKSFCKEVFSNKFKSKFVDEAITAAILINYCFKTYQNEELVSNQEIKDFVKKYLKSDIIFDNFLFTIIYHMGIDNLNEFMKIKDNQIKAIKNPKALIFLNELDISLKESLMFRIDEEIREGKLNLYDELFFYWYILKNKELSKNKKDVVSEVNALIENFSRRIESEELPALVKGVLYDLTKEISDGYVVVAKEELKGRGMTRFGPIIEMTLLFMYGLGMYKLFQHKKIVIEFINKISRYYDLLLLVAFVTINILLIILLYTLFMDTIVNGFPDKIVLEHLKKRFKKVTNILKLLSWIKGFF